MQALQSEGRTRFQHHCHRRHRRRRPASSDRFERTLALAPELPAQNVLMCRAVMLIRFFPWQNIDLMLQRGLHLLCTSWTRIFTPPPGIKGSLALAAKAKTPQP